jgi:hypothetical protein
VDESRFGRERGGLFEIHLALPHEAYPEQGQIPQNPPVFYLSEKKIPHSACLFEKYPYLCRRNELNFVKMIVCTKYTAPRVEQIRLQSEGIMTEFSCYPTIKDGEVWYEEYSSVNLETPVGQDVQIF